MIGEDDYAELRRKERIILTSAMRNVRARGIASNDFSWADRISELLGSSAASGSDHPVNLGAAKVNPALA